MFLAHACFTPSSLSYKLLIKTYLAYCAKIIKSVIEDCIVKIPIICAAIVFAWTPGIRSFTYDKNSDEFIYRTRSHKGYTSKSAAVSMPA